MLHAAVFETASSHNPHCTVPAPAGDPKCVGACENKQTKSCVRTAPTEPCLQCKLLPPPALWKNPLHLNPVGLRCARTLSCAHTPAPCHFALRPSVLRTPLPLPPALILRCAQKACCAQTNLAVRPTWQVLQHHIAKLLPLSALLVQALPLKRQFALQRNHVLLRPYTPCRPKKPVE